MNRLSDFKGEKGVMIAAELLPVIMDILAIKENQEQKGETNAVKMFSAFMKRSPKEMMHIFAILSEEDPETYTCDGAEAMANMLILASDPILVGLFISQRQMGDATSSGSASESTEGN